MTQRDATTDNRFGLPDRLHRGGGFGRLQATEDARNERGS